MATSSAVNVSSTSRTIRQSVVAHVLFRARAVRSSRVLASSSESDTSTELDRVTGFIVV